MPAATPERRTCDVLVVGSGAGGLSAAITAAHHGLDVVVAEKEAVVGGTTAWSGGWLWIPRNPLAVRAGIVEDARSPRRYLESELGNRAGDPRIGTFLENGPAMIEFFERHTALEFLDGNKVPDFHETPGAAAGGRSVTAAPYDGRSLGRWIHMLRPPLAEVSLAGMGIAGGSDMSHFFNARHSLASALHVAGRLARHGRDLVVHRRAMQLVNGNALAARLLRSAVDLGVTLLTDTRAVRLLGEAGRIAGAAVTSGGVETEFRAGTGVVLAAGGFPHDFSRIAGLFAHAPDGTGHFSAAPPSNTGDGLDMAEAVGAAVETDLASPAAWAPVSLVPLPGGGTAHFPHLVERAKPGFIAVGQDGRRFVNEADSYHDFMKALFAITPAGRAPSAWLVCDHDAQRHYGLGWSKPFPFPLRPYLRSGYLRRSDTLAGLADACGIDAAALGETVRTFNDHARRGEDPAFGRGRTAYNRVQGDGAHRPNPALGPLDRPPFYAVRIVPGSLGTFAGLRTDAHARVLSRDGRPIAGLFAVGNDMSSIFGGHYPSGGITLGPAMTFGYVAGRVLAGLSVPGTPDASEPAEKEEHQEGRSHGTL